MRHAVRLVCTALLVLAFAAGPSRHGVSEARAQAIGDHHELAMAADTGAHPCHEDGAADPGPAAPHAKATCSLICCVPIVLLSPMKGPAILPSAYVRLPPHQATSLAVKPSLPPPRG